MGEVVSAKDFLAGETPLILDVRSPGEFQAGHIPGAVNFPLFTDEERASVGTVYKQKGADLAIALGLEYVGPKLAGFVREAHRINPRKLPMRMYCFRGGQRSHSMAWLLEGSRFPITLLRGGYKAYRREVVWSFAEPQNVTILSGCTGAGKTRLLRALKARGRQVLDLEGLSFHKGSAFGGYEQPETLTTEMFHNLIHQEWAQLDRGRPVWIEDEGRTMGRLLIPDEIWQQMRAAPVVFLDIAQEHRVSLLVEEYANHDSKLLRDSVDRIKKRLGGLTHKRCIEALDASRPDLVAKHCLDYYDKAYRHSLEKRQPDPYWELSLPGIDTESNTEALLEFMASAH